MKKIYTSIITITILLLSGCATTTEETRAYESSFRTPSERTYFVLDEGLVVGEFPKFLGWSEKVTARAGRYEPLVEDDKGVYYYTKWKDLWKERYGNVVLFISHDKTYTKTYFYNDAKNILTATNLIPGSGFPLPFHGESFNVIENIVICSESSG
jgi:hypothetical protein